MIKLMKVSVSAVLLVISSVAMAKTGLRVEDPWVRMVPPVSVTTAGYFRMCNKTDADNALVAVSSPAAKVVEMHTVEESNGASTMKQIQSVEMPAGSCTEFAPGGRHLMFIDLVNPLNKDDKVAVTLRFKNGEELKAMFEVKKGKDEHHRHGDHHHDHHKHHEHH